MNENKMVSAIKQILELSFEQKVKTLIGSLLVFLALYLNKKFDITPLYDIINNITIPVVCIISIYCLASLLYEIPKYFLSKHQKKILLKNLTPKEKQWLLNKIQKKQRNNNGVEEFSNEMIGLRNQGVLISGKLITMGYGIEDMTHRGSWSINDDYWRIIQSNPKIIQ